MYTSCHKDVLVALLTLPAPAQKLLSMCKAYAHFLLASYRRATSLRNGPTSLGPCASPSASVLEFTGQYRIITPAMEQPGRDLYVDVHQIQSACCQPTSQAVRSGPCMYCSTEQFQHEPSQSPTAAKGLAVCMQSALHTLKGRTCGVEPVHLVDEGLRKHAAALPVHPQHHIHPGIHVCHLWATHDVNVDAEIVLSYYAVSYASDGLYLSQEWMPSSGSQW